MPAQAFEDATDLHIDLLEAVLPTLESPTEHLACYPLPFLKKIGDQETRRFRTLVLENSYLKLTVVPALGGRILSVFDKRSHTEILASHPALEVQRDGPRGAHLKEGIQFHYLDQPRDNSLGNIDTLIPQQMSEEEPATVWIGETFSGGALSFQMQIALAADAAYFEVQVRTLNRSDGSVPYAGHLQTYLGSGQLVQLETGAIYDSDRGNGLGMIFARGDFDVIEASNNSVGLKRNQHGATLAARQSDTFRVGFVPYSGVQHPTILNEVGVGSFTTERLEFNSSQPLLKHRLFIQNSEGQSFDTELDVYPEAAIHLPLDSIPGKARQGAIRTPSKTDLIRFSVTPATVPPVTLDNNVLQTPHGFGISDDQATDRPFLVRATRNSSLRHTAYVKLASLEAHKANYSGAAAFLEDALLFNGDDPLAWWAKAVMIRLGALNDEDQERTELLNAHFLSPLEPALRAEAFLSQAHEHGKDPSPLLGALEDNPENFIEVACLLIDLGLYGEATRWIDEAVRHKDLAMLRYLQASLFLQGSRMEAEASEQVAMGHRAQIPPYPFRAIELKALTHLATRFVNDNRLWNILAIAQKALTIQALDQKS